MLVGNKFVQKVSKMIIINFWIHRISNYKKKLRIYIITIKQLLLFSIFQTMVKIRINSITEATELNMVSGQAPLHKEDNSQGVSHFAPLPAAVEPLHLLQR